MKKEMAILSTSPPAGISCYPAGDSDGGAAADIPRLLHATVLGTPGTVNEGGVFRLDVVIPARCVYVCVCVFVCVCSKHKRVMQSMNILSSLFFERQY